MTRTPLNSRAVGMFSHDGSTIAPANIDADNIFWQFANP